MVELAGDLDWFNAWWEKRVASREHPINSPSSRLARYLPRANKDCPHGKMVDRVVCVVWSLQEIRRAAVV